MTEQPQTTTSNPPTQADSPSTHGARHHSAPIPPEDQGRATGPMYIITEAGSSVVAGRARTVEAADFLAAELAKEHDSEFQVFRRISAHRCELHDVADEDVADELET